MKKVNYIIILVLSFIILGGVLHVSALAETDVISTSYIRLDGPNNQSGTAYCSDPNFIKPFRFLGRIFAILKILIPVIIIAFGVFDLFRSVIASKDDEIKKSTKSLIMRIVSGVIIFFVPTIINVIFSLVDDWNKYATDYSVCTRCIMNPNKC